MDTHTWGTHEREEGEELRDTTGGEGGADSFVLGGVEAGRAAPTPPAMSDAEEEDSLEDEESDDKSGRGRKEKRKRKEGEVEEERALEVGLCNAVTPVLVFNRIYMLRVFFVGVMYTVQVYMYIYLYSIYI